MSSMSNYLHITKSLTENWSAGSVNKLLFSTENRNKEAGMVDCVST